MIVLFLRFSNPLLQAPEKHNIKPEKGERSDPQNQHQKVVSHVSLPSSEVQKNKKHVDQFDPDEGNRDSPQTVDEEIAPQKGRRPHWPVGDSLESERDQRRNDDKRGEVLT